LRAARAGLRRSAPSRARRFCHNHQPREPGADDDDVGAGVRLALARAAGLGHNCRHRAHLRHYRVRPLMLHPRPAPITGPLTRRMWARPSQSCAISLVVSLKALRMPAGRTATRCTHTRHCDVSNEISNASLEFSRRESQPGRSAAICRADLTSGRVLPIRGALAKLRYSPYLAECSGLPGMIADEARSTGGVKPGSWAFRLRGARRDL
jgi:hypothetical protein